MKFPHFAGKHRLAKLVALAAAATVLGSAPAAFAATGGTVGNGGVSAYATSSCSNGWINATIHITSKRNNQYVSVRSAALYDGAYGSSYYAQRDNAAEFSPMIETYLYATQTARWTWSESAPTYTNASLDGDQVVFFVAAYGYSTLPVKVSCPT